MVEAEAAVSDLRKDVDIYPLSCYYFGSKEAIVFKDQTLYDRTNRMKSNYATYGLRTSVEAVMLVELFKHPHLLLLQLRNSIFKLPGGRLRPGESDINGLRRKLTRKLSASEDADENKWEVGECLGMWWRHDFETLFYPYLPPNERKPKECTKLFLVRLPESRKFVVPENLKLLAVPLREVHENHKTYGQIISGVPHLLSKFSINVIDTLICVLNTDHKGSGFEAKKTFAMLFFQLEPIGPLDLVLLIQSLDDTSLLGKMKRTKAIGAQLETVEAGPGGWSKSACTVAYTKTLSH